MKALMCRLAPFCMFGGFAAVVAGVIASQFNLIWAYPLVGIGLVFYIVGRIFFHVNKNEVKKKSPASYSKDDETDFSIDESGNDEEKN